MLALGHGKEKDEVSPRRISTWGKKDPNSNPDPDAVDFKYSLVQNIMSIDAGGLHSAVVATVR